MALRLSQTGLNLIKQFEGCLLKAYKCPAGIWTIGYGHTGSAKEGQVISQKQADDLLEKDVQKFVEGVNRFIKVELNQNQFDALVSFAFNCGLGSLQSSTLLNFINIKQFDKAALEFDKWNKVRNPKTKQLEVSTGLTRRRSEEKALFNTPVIKTEEKKGEIVLNLMNLNGSQFQMLAKVYENARKKGLLSSDKWEKKASDKTLTVDEATFLNGVILGSLIK